MTGDLRVKNGYWQMRFSWKDANGKWQRKEESTHLPEKGNKRLARKMLEERQKKLEDVLAKTQDVKEPLFLDEMAKWFDDVMPFDVRGKTLNQYLATFHKHIQPYPPFQKVTVSQVTTKLLQGYVNAKAKEGLAPETIRKHHANLHKFLDYLWKLEMIPVNPADKVTLPKRNRTQRGTVYTADQLQKLFDLFHDDPLELVIYITATYGLRRSEVCGLRWDAVDLNSGYLYIQHTAIVDCGKVVYSDRTKSESSRRRLPLTPMLHKMLRAEWRKQAENQLRMGTGYHREGFVCCWPDGSPMLPEYVSNHYRKVLKDSELPFIQFRNLRDTAATILHRQGFDAKSIQGWLGHADASSTANIYIHAQEMDMQDMASSMEGALKQA